MSATMKAALRRDTGRKPNNARVKVHTGARCGTRVRFASEYDADYIGTRIALVRYYHPRCRGFHLAKETQ